MVMDRVQHLPRHHLGSTLYQTTVSPTSTDPGEESKFAYVSTPIPIPRFDEKENCTFTVRVPRLYLTQDRREEICERRALWGADIYTDDSDPIAVAIHSGWLRGAWDEEEDFDLSVFNLGDTEDGAKAKALELSKSKDPVITISEPPPAPMYPVHNRDLHITLLILPRLVSYASHAAHGIMSREWKTKHDGMSFKIEKIAWVDEKAGKGEERGGEARRKRLRALEELKNDARLLPKVSMNFAKEATDAENATPRAT